MSNQPEVYRVLEQVRNLDPVASAEKKKGQVGQVSFFARTKIFLTHRQPAKKKTCPLFFILFFIMNHLASREGRVTSYKG